MEVPSRSSFLACKASESGDSVGKHYPEIGIG